jgi:hypothetical protein
MTPDEKYKLIDITSLYLLEVHKLLKNAPDDLAQAIELLTESLERLSEEKES